MRRLALIACLAAATGVHAAEPWQRAWTIERVICPTCDARTLAGINQAVGRKITLAPGRFTNPLYTSCESGADYSDIQPRPAEIAARLMLPGALPPTSGAVLAGAVKCARASGPGNTVARVVFDGATGYYLFEEGAIIVLK
ncbi:MAG: hypothetical protein KF889_25780 [Alphaproteobacteria bacterium]|nr:hypothetical protein [Alphaproteobacteria bacterium]MCW5739594.1 hypothetical protein [Alphaproteobacteria bacterium]